MTDVSLDARFSTIISPVAEVPVLGKVTSRCRERFPLSVCARTLPRAFKVS